MWVLSLIEDYLMTHYEPLYEPIQMLRSDMAREVAGEVSKCTTDKELDTENNSGHR